MKTTQTKTRERRIWTLPPIPRVDYQTRIKTRSDTETFLISPAEMRNQLGMLLEIPSLLCSEIQQDYTQKTVQNLELAQEFMKVP